MLFQRREIPWEVVDSKNVDPVPIYFESEGNIEFKPLYHLAK